MQSKDRQEKATIEKKKKRPHLSAVMYREACNSTVVCKLNLEAAYSLTGSAAGVRGVVIECAAIVTIYTGSGTAC